MTFNYYTDNQVNQFVKSMTVLVDTREKANKHIINYFNEKSVAYKSKALESGDYSVLIPAFPEMGLPLPQTLNKPIDGGLFIERKNSLEELAGNLGRFRDRFEAELQRMKNAEKHLIIESGSWQDIILGNYDSNLGAKAYYNSLLTFISRYNLHIHFTTPKFAGCLIRGICENKIKEVFQL